MIIFVRYKHEFVVTVIAITEFDCNFKVHCAKIMTLNISGLRYLVNKHFDINTQRIS